MHPQRMKDGGLGASEALDQPLLGEAVHQKAYGAAIHAVDRDWPPQDAMQRFEHEAVATQRHHNLRVEHRNIAVEIDQAFAGFLRQECRCRDDGYAFEPLLAEDLFALKGRTVERLGRAHASFRWSSTGMSRRTLSVMVRSARPVTQPTPSDAKATTWPHGSQSSEWP